MSKFKLIFLLTILLLSSCWGEEKELSPTRTFIPLDTHFDRRVQDFAFILPHMKPVAAVPGTGLRASECGTCHTEIYAEWQASTHASALQDIQFQGELVKKTSPQWLCLNCHIPLQDQRRYLVRGIYDNDVLRPVMEDNPHFDAELQKESITCASCHVRADGQGNSLVIGPRGSDLSPHPVKHDPDHLRAICLRCHDPKGPPLTRNLVCWFMTADELTDARKQLSDSQGGIPDCVDCHMPETERRLVPAMAGLPIRKTRRHHWTGSGIPKRYDGYATLLQRGFEPALEVRLGPIRRDAQRSTLSIDVDFANTKAGHWLPTGDPERFILLLVRLEDKQGKVLVQQKQRIGQDWVWDPAEKMADNRLKQGERRTWPVRLEEQAQASHLVVMALHVRLTSKNGAYLMQAKGVNESYLPNGNQLVAHADQNYPFATYIYRESIELATGERHKENLEQLLERSHAEKEKPLDKRDY